MHTYQFATPHPLLPAFLTQPVTVITAHHCPLETTLRPVPPPDAGEDRPKRSVCCGETCENEGYGICPRCHEHTVFEADKTMDELWAEDSSLERWFPFSAQQLESLQSELAAARQQCVKLREALSVADRALELGERLDTSQDCSEGNESAAFAAMEARETIKKALAAAGSGAGESLFGPSVAIDLNTAEIIKCPRCESDHVSATPSGLHCDLCQNEWAGAGAGEAYCGQPEVRKKQDELAAALQERFGPEATANDPGREAVSVDGREFPSQLEAAKHLLWLIQRFCFYEPEREGAPADGPRFREAIKETRKFLNKTGYDV